MKAFFQNFFDFAFISQALPSQLARITLLLVVALTTVHHSPTLLLAIANESMSSGCHTVSSSPDHSQHHSHHQAHEHHHHNHDEHMHHHSH